MKKLIGLVLVAVLMIPAVAHAGASTDAALALGAFAVFTPALAGVGVFGGVPAVATPVYAAPAPVVAPPVYVAPRPVYVAPRPVYVAPAPVYVAPRVVAHPVIVRERVVVHRAPVYHYWHHPYRAW